MRRARKWENASSDTAFTYNSWCHMRNRCYNKEATNYGYYGGRGIEVCDRWRDNYDTFYEDMGPRPVGTSIERINNNLNYEPGNCRWATKLEQARNRGDNDMHTMDEMCRAGGTTRRGVRHWEDIGLLGPVTRTSGDTRQFTPEQLDRARIIAAASFGGWKLEEIKEMLETYHVEPEIYEALTIRLSDQIRAAARLAEQLPVPLISKATKQEYDL